MKKAFVFPGQGSQYVGMGLDLYEGYEAARAVFAEADETLGFPLSRLCFEGPEEALTDTANAQPAIFTVSMAFFQVVKALAWEATPWAEPRDEAFLAGHSLGEYSAFVAAGALNFPDALCLLRERGHLMKEAGSRAPGGMAAVLNLEKDALEDICRQAQEQTGGMVRIANYNSPTQLVISGDKEALARAMELAKERGARRVVPLAVSAAFHSPLMASIVEEFRRAVESTPVQTASIPVLANATATPLIEEKAIREEMVAQLTAPVRWVESVQYMIAQGVAEFVEIGPKDVLTGLIRRIDGQVKTTNVGKVEELKAFLGL